MVDCDSYVILAAEVVPDTNDRRQLVPMMRKMEENTGTEGEKKTGLGDCGFASAEGYSEIENTTNIDLYVPTQQQVSRRRKPVSEFDKSRFQVDVEKKTCICPQGQPMCFRGFGLNKQGETTLRFCGTACPQCPFQKNCARGKFRTLTVLKIDPLIKKMEEKMDSVRGKAMSRLRSSTVEPVIGVLKEHMGFRQFRLRGLNGVNCELKLLTIGYNIRKLHLMTLEKGLKDANEQVKIKIQEITEVINAAFLLLFDDFSNFLRKSTFLQPQIPN